MNCLKSNWSIIFLQIYFYIRDIDFNGYSCHFWAMIILSLLHDLLICWVHAFKNWWPRGPINLHKSGATCRWLILELYLIKVLLLLYLHCLEFTRVQFFWLHRLLNLFFNQFFLIPHFLTSMLLVLTYLHFTVSLYRWWKNSSITIGCW